MSSKILDLLEDQDLRIRLGNNGKLKVAGSYSIENISKKIACLIQRYYSPISFENNVEDSKVLTRIFGEQMKLTTAKLDKSQSQLQESQSQLQESQSQLQESQSQLQESQSQLQLANIEIEKMNQTKIWKLRKKWLKLKSLVLSGTN